MRLVKGEIMKFKDGQKPAGFEKFGYCVVVQTGDFDIVGVLPSDQYGQTKERDFQAVAVSSLERTGRLIWEFDYTLFPHIIELLKEYYEFAVSSDEQV
ncbi:MAG: hypothetical protein C4291_10060 [Candidatus Dadabacteria bacterium]